MADSARQIPFKVTDPSRVVTLNTKAPVAARDHFAVSRNKTEHLIELYKEDVR